MTNSTMSKAQDNKKGAIFNIIKYQMMNTLRDCERKGELVFTKGLPTNVIAWLQKNQVARFNGLKKELNKGQGNKYIYHVYFTDLNPYSVFLKESFERIEKKGYASQDSVTVKFGKIYDKYRSELECTNWSSERDETGYAPAPWNERGIEKLTLADDPVFEMFVQSIGYDNYAEYELYDHNEDVIKELYQYFREHELVKEYQQGEEDDMSDKEIEQLLALA